ncbi:MAG: hypothetical protein R2823_06270 [Acidimicrobiia bacterium]
MGQRIEVDRTTVIGDSIVVSTNRSLTGTDGEGFNTASDAAASESFAGALATELFEADHDLSRVYIDQNALIIGRRGGWDVESTAAATKVIEDFFLFYPEA